MFNEINLEEKKHISFARFVDRITFARIFSLWIIIIIVFGLVYHSFSAYTTGSNYIASLDGNRITGFVDAIYYSFVTATSTGYGDITPKGKALRSIAIVEVIFSLLMAALVTSKLVSLKQEKMVEQIYNLNFSEKINKLVNSFSFLSVELDSAIGAIKSNNFDRKSRFDLKMNVNSLKKNLFDIKKELFQNEYITKNIDQVQMEYILLGMHEAFTKLNETIHEMDTHKVNARGSLIEEFYTTSNIGLELLSCIKKETPLYTSKVADVEATIRQMKPMIMNYAIAEHEKELEVLNPEIIMQ